MLQACSADPGRDNVYNFTHPNSTFPGGTESDRLNLLLPKGTLDLVRAPVFKVGRACVLPSDTPDLVHLLLHHAEGAPRTVPAQRYDAGARVFDACALHLSDLAFASVALLLRHGALCAVTGQPNHRDIHGRPRCREVCCDLDQPQWQPARLHRARGALDTIASHVR